MPHFTDDIDYSDVVNNTLYQLVLRLTEFDFRILPDSVIGNILENLVPKEEKQKFGQYYTPDILAYLVAFPVVQTKHDFLFDPTSGTGTFLDVFYKILNFYCQANQVNHADLLSQIWGNDVSHFPALLSVINLYKQNMVGTNNFPRVMRKDFFSISVGNKLSFPDSQDCHKHIELPIPRFDGIASNFPFIQQEDIPNDSLSALFQGEFQTSQPAFMKGDSFSINRRSDYFTYCFYHSFSFLKENGWLSAITSNAWLGKEYGIQFKKFLLDNFHIKYIVRSDGEHWFSDSQVSAIYVVLQKGKRSEPTKFVTLHFKLNDRFDRDNVHSLIKEIEEFYADIDTCDHGTCSKWKLDGFSNDLYLNDQEDVSVCVVPRYRLESSLSNKENWFQYFHSANPIACFSSLLEPLYPKVIDVFRGERTGWNDMFIIPEEKLIVHGIEKDYLLPCIKSPNELKGIEFSGSYQFYMFVCVSALEDASESARKWICQFTNLSNKNGSATIQQSCISHHPYWYSIQPKQADIVIAINPYERFFFTFSTVPFTVDQRLIAIRVKEGYDVELVAALLNSAITFLMLELRGTARHQGVLDLNANYLKKLPLLNPDKLDDRQKQNILEAFQPLRKRSVESIFEEVKREDRIQFDKVVLKSFGIEERCLENIYSLLLRLVDNRISLKKK